MTSESWGDHPYANDRQLRHETINLKRDLHLDVILDSSEKLIVILSAALEVPERSDQHRAQLKKMVVRFGDMPETSR